MLIREVPLFFSLESPIYYKVYLDNFLKTAFRIPFVCVARRDFPDIGLSEIHLATVPLLLDYRAVVGITTIGAQGRNLPGIPQLLTTFFCEIWLQFCHFCS